MQHAVDDNADDFLERIENAEVGDVVIFDESGGSSTARKTQAVELKKFLQTERKE